MITAKSLNNLLNEFEQKNIFKFTRHECKFILVGAPHWRAFSVSGDSPYWVEIEPVVNLNIRKIDFLHNGDFIEKGFSNINTVTLHSPVIDANNEAPKEGNENKEQKFFDSIPKELHDQVKMFSNSHWDFLKAITFFGEKLSSFIISNPGLAYILVNLGKLHASYSIYNNYSYMSRLIESKQKEILNLALFNGSERLVKIFRKFDPAILEVEALIHLRNSLKLNSVIEEQILKILSHSKQINKNLFHFLAYEPSLLQIIMPNAIAELSQSHSFKEDLKKLKDIRSLSDKWKIKVAEIEQQAKIEKAMGRLLDQVEKKRIKMNQIIIPEPPLPDTENIVAIRNEDEQKAWSKHQHNCIDTLYKNVAKGRSRFYKVFYGSEEATLEIHIEKHGISKGSLLGYKNSQVSNELRLMVDEWFNSNIVPKTATDLRSPPKKVEPILIIDSSDLFVSRP
ncbi:MAG: hypothetical protein V1720_18950 [bacterium]